MIVFLIQGIVGYTFKNYKQDDPAWANDKLGKSDLTLGVAGSAITAASVIVDACLASSTPTTPATLNTWFTNNFGYTSNFDVRWSKLVNHGLVYLGTFPPETLQSHLSGATKMVLARNGIQKHYVVVTGAASGNKFNVVDPSAQNKPIFQQSSIQLQVFQCRPRTQAEIDLEAARKKQVILALQMVQKLQKQGSGGLASLGITDVRVIGNAGALGYSNDLTKIVAVFKGSAKPVGQMFTDLAAITLVDAGDLCSGCKIGGAFYQQWTAIQSDVQNAYNALKASYSSAGYFSTGLNYGGVLAVLSMMKLRPAKASSYPVSLPKFGNYQAVLYAEASGELVRVESPTDVVGKYPKNEFYTQLNQLPIQDQRMFQKYINRMRKKVSQLPTQFKANSLYRTSSSVMLLGDKQFDIVIQKLMDRALSLSFVDDYSGEAVGRLSSSTIDSYVALSPK